MIEIVSQVWIWHWFSQPHGYNFNGFFVAHPDGNLCIDPVEPPAAALDHMREKGVGTIAITNRNHVRAANRVREACNARTLIHAADAEYARSQGAEIDGNLSVGNRVGPFVIVGVPGKSAGEVALHWPERRVLVVGDAVIGNPPGQCSLLREKVLDDPPKLRQSIKVLLDLDFDTLLVGDGEPILKGAKDRLRELTERW